ncbi:hypothetical protein E5D57_012387 [Metarhizium anisopliae]|nr:hypothetical protein E5D57_012387 [Metarhizium anisopliae]
MTIDTIGICIKCNRAALDVGSDLADANQSAVEVPDKKDVSRRESLQVHSWRDESSPVSDTFLTGR